MENLYLENQKLQNAIPNLKSRSEMLSTEEWGVFVEKIASFFTSKIPEVAKSFFGNIERTNALSKDQYNSFVAELIDLDKPIEKIVDTARFSDVATINIPVMLGLRPNLLKNVEELSRGITIINNDLAYALDYCDKLIAKVLSDKNFRMSTKPLSGNDKIWEAKRKLEDVIGHIIDANGVKDSMKINDLLPNISSLVKIRETLLQTAKGSTLSELENINKNTKRIAEKTDALYDYLNKNDETTISRVVLNELSGVLEDTAGLVTSSVTLWHIMNQLSTTVKFTVTRLSEYVDKK